MSSEHNSILVSKLYTSNDVEEALDILEEMEEINDPIFLQPIIDAYKKYKDTSSGHYFLSALGPIQSKDIQTSLMELFQQIKGDDSGKRSRLPWVVSAIREHKFYPEEVNDVVLGVVKNFTDSIYFEPMSKYGYDLGSFLKYCAEAGIMEELTDSLKVLWEHKEVGKQEKAIILYRLLRIKSANPFDYLLENYKPMEDKDADVILSKELVGWTGRKVDKLKKIIMKSGYVRAQEILQAEKIEIEKKQKVEAQENQQKITETFSNSKIVHDIRTLRRQINNKALSNPNFQFNLFPANELLIDQSQNAKSREELTQHCIDLRSIISDIENGVSNHQLDQVAIDTLLVGIEEQDKGKTLNQLYLYLRSKGYEVDISLFGIRKLNRILSLVAHPDDEKLLLKELKSQGLLDDYNIGNFSNVHHQLLIQYGHFLIELDKVLIVDPKTK